MDIKSYSLAKNIENRDRATSFHFNYEHASRSELRVRDFGGDSEWDPTVGWLSPGRQVELSTRSPVGGVSHLRGQGCFFWRETGASCVTAETSLAGPALEFALPLLGLQGFDEEEPGTGVTAGYVNIQAVFYGFFFH